VRLAGVVADEATWTPVAAAKITLLGTDLEALSEANGNFTLLDAPLGPATVKVEAPGYVTMVQRVDIRADAVVFVQFILPGVHALLDEILVAGTRPQPGVLVETRTAADLLAGKLPGVASNSGMVGLNLQAVRLRGVNSFTIQGEPEIYLDGVRMAGGFGDALRTLQQIPATDVRDIQILRGPTAAFIAGSVDGAILVRTKGGPN
jgi:hypothetical protein